MGSIGDFAENLINNELASIQEGKSPEVHMSVPKSDVSAPDISRVEVPEDFMKELLGENFYPQDSKPVDTIPELEWQDPNPKPEPKSEPITLSEETAQQLIPILEEVKGLLQEMSAAMTSSGSIGVNFAGPQSDPECTYKKPKRKKSKTSRKAALKEAINNLTQKK